jgi:hypothetical protein
VAEFDNLAWRTIELLFTPTKEMPIMVGKYSLQRNLFKPQSVPVNFEKLTLSKVMTTK